MLLKLRVAAAAAFALGLSMTVPAGAQKTINVPGDYPTIQQAVNAANANDTVLVQPGTYQENVVITLPITLTSSACAGSSPAANCNTLTTIDGSLANSSSQSGSVITISNVLSLKTVISGFSLINAISNYTGDPAGVELDNAGATITNNVFSNDRAMLLMNAGAMTFTNNQVITATDVANVCKSDNGLILTGTNTMVMDSTGVTAAVTTITGNTISGASKCFGGVGINDEQGNNIYIGSNQISGQTLAINVASTNALTYLYNNLIYNNSTGGVYFNHETNSPPADPADTFLINNTFVNNLSAAKGLTGAAGPAEVYVTGTYSKIALINNIFSTNSATNPILDCAGAAPSASNQVTAIILDHNLFYNSATNGKLGADGCPVTTGTYGNINANPGFVSTTNFQLATGSPAIDTGDNSFETIFPFVSDLNGNGRVENGTGLTSPIVDMGAYEVPCIGTVNGPFDWIAASSSSYYLVSGNSFTLTGQLLAGNDGLSGVGVSGKSLTFTGSGGVAPVTVTTDANGNASVPYTIALPGLYAFTVSFAGNGTYGPATSLVLYVYVTNPLAVTTLGLSSSKNPSLVGQSVTFTVTSNATDGTHPSPVVLADNGTTLMTLVTTSGTATYTTSSLTQGSHPLTATFAGDGAHTSGSFSLTQLVGNYTTTTTTLKSSVNPSFFSQSVTLTANVSSASGVPTGSVMFMDGSTQLGAAVPVDANGNATYTTTAFTTGAHNLAANFTATGTYANSSGTLAQTVNPDPTQSVLAVTPSGGAYGTAIMLTATVSVPAPYAASGPATGTVTFYDGPVVLGTAPLATAGSGSTASFSTASLGAGTHNLTCVYAGGGSLASSTCNTVPITITVAATSLTLASSANPSPALTPITFTVHLTTTSTAAFAAGSTVTLTVTPTGSSPASYTLTTDSTGAATYTSAGLMPGSYSVAAAYAGSTNYSSSSNRLTQTVTANATSITLIAAPNPGIQNNNVSLLATVAATAGAAAPTGSVAFFDGTNQLSTLMVSSAGGTISSATLNLSTLTPGNHTLTAVFTPSIASFLGSTSAALALYIAPQDFSLTANPPSLSVQSGHHGTVQLAFTSIGGFAAPIYLYCPSNLPAYVTCEPPPAAIVLNGNATVNANLTFDTDALLNFYGSNRAPASPGSFGRIVLASLLPLALFGLTRKRFRSMRTLAAIASLAILGGTLTACSGKQPGQTPPGTYVISMTATGTTAGSSAPTSHSLNITLKVTQ